MITRMTMGRPQKRCDHRLRELVRRTGDLTIATELGVPRSTARGWLCTTPTVTVSLDMANLTELELRQEVLKLRQRVQKLATLLRPALVLLRVSGFTLAGERLPHGPDKLRILCAIDQAAYACHGGLSCSGSGYRRVGSTHGDGSTPCVGSTTSRPVRARRRID